MKFKFSWVFYILSGSSNQDAYSQSSNYNVEKSGWIDKHLKGTKKENFKVNVNDLEDTWKIVNNKTIEYIFVK